VDLGLRSGFAAYGRDGRLISYRSQHYANLAALRRAVVGILNGLPGLERLVVEGGGPIAEAWEKESGRRGLVVRKVAAEVWRGELLPRREWAKGARSAKEAADRMARRVIEWSGAARPTSLRHDAAEAILVGLWGVLEAGWLAAPPAELSR
jgi:hypothetical protein